ncbi:hypothetical protein WA026_008529 [Henosepilachna vigintioctopunctata]|uniref:G-protein coupled receptors family 1 profile domain-containing protein n=1 Tax=Henosepilachna vigintioctopunctata TaxID=420089 RepID=A0AAW1UH09_9CUCU
MSDRTVEKNNLPTDVNFSNNPPTFVPGFELLEIYCNIRLLDELGVYVRISYKLRYRFDRGFTSEENSNNRRQLRGRRLHRTNILLSAISIIFCISWMPLNLFNLIADLYSDEINFTSQTMVVAYAMCHLMGMSSACSNPVLYGCLNENFLKEFKDILRISSKSDCAGGEAMSLRKQSKRASKKDGKGDFVTAATDYQQCNTVSTEMSVLTKC